jgi:ribosome modulation factor
MQTISRVRVCPQNGSMAIMVTKEERQQRWQHGYDARYSGKVEAENPYKRSSPDYHFWQDGWFHAEIELARGGDE